jgi:tRNA pseudouridine55 synthase
MNINGILNVNKPEGITSFGVVSRMKYITGERHIGHTGTLDPMATGVLPVCFGQATKISGFILDNDKTYTAEIETGIATDTYDREGKIIQRLDTTSITVEQVKNALKSFVGTIEQVPPLFSAKKYRGKRLYKLARTGVAFLPHARKVTINSIKLLSIDLPVIAVEVDCSKGTYIRSLANDLGQKLECGAHLKSLIRTRSGKFNISGAIGLPEIEKAFHDGSWASIVYPLDFPLTEYKKVVVNDEQLKHIIHGLSIHLEIEPNLTKGIVRTYNGKGQFLAMLKYNTGTALWHPYRVFAGPAEDYN